jgi:hypothetical protein
MYGTTYMHHAPLTVTDEQLQPLRSNQQLLAGQKRGDHLIKRGEGSGPVVLTGTTPLGRL